MTTASTEDRAERNLFAEGVATLLQTLPYSQSYMEEASYERAVEVFRKADDHLAKTQQATSKAVENSSSSRDVEEDVLQERMVEVMHIKSRIRTVELPPSLARTFFPSCNDHNPFVVYRRTIHLEGRSLETRSLSSSFRKHQLGEHQTASDQSVSLLDYVESALLCYNTGLTFHLCAIAPTHTTTMKPLRLQQMSCDDNLHSAMKLYQAALSILTVADVQHKEELKSFHLLWELDRIDNCKKEDAHYDDDDASNNVEQFWLAYFLLRLALVNNITHIHAHFLNWVVAQRSIHQTVDAINTAPVAKLFCELRRRAAREHRDTPATQMNVMDNEENEPRNVNNENVVTTTMKRDLVKLWSNLERPTLKLDTAPAA